ncbi:DNA-3-methyladenine glycosylase family protein [Methylobacterium sp. J-068]|uniref:DNA-3-methyladenine glycosylase family protein n=1 Tax=Methylobacterium sp. J-068 TaxID=2836649 RepID=UPI001FBB7F73|nr:DNA-3-methyladenine glycosylase 2 family protein [Methylobacterium sp. J-068]MCJ2032948.1 DNA-3-methyladenine glycosylase 2 family protein [Methylobacterium sp. J-068]
MPRDSVHHHVLSVAGRLSAPLAEAIARVGPLTIEPPAQTRVADRLCVEVVNQQLSIRAAAAIWSRVEAAAAGMGLTPWGLFVPAHEAVLRACGISGNKVRALQAIRAADEAGLLDATLGIRPHAERSAILCRIKGVGPWTADMIGIFHFGDPDIWPDGDVAAVGRLRRLTGRADTQAVAAAFAPYRSHLARYAWRIKDLFALTPPLLERERTDGV